MLGSRLDLRRTAFAARSDIPSITMKRARISDWVRTRRYDEPSKDLVRSSLRQSCPDCIIATHGYSFREGQVNFPLFQLTVAIAVIVLLQAADSRSVFGKIFSALDLLVDLTVRLCAATFEVKSFTKSWLTTGFMIAYVYITGLLIVFLAKAAIRAAVELVARSNALGLTNAIARERGIAAYRAWLPLERIRPAHIAQEKWEERFAWPADGKPPYPPLTHRVVR